MKAILETIRVLAFGLFWLVVLVARLIEVDLMMSDKIDRITTHGMSSVA